ncbi:MAG TPA: hypothetical protein VG817_07635, partial [Gemmatimonadales bacterium]|nr:hypothetical protein [Gemmatimonadales bacterium]
ICSVYDSGETPEGELWYTMPFIAGESLRDRLDSEPRLPISTAVRIAREAAQGLEAAHWSAIGYALILSGELDRAEPILRRAMRLDSFNLTVLSNMALVLAEKGSTQEAARLSDQMRVRMPYDHEVMAQQVWFHARAGDAELARAMLDTLQLRMQRNGTSDVPLVIAFAGTGDTLRARAALQRSVDRRDYG